MRLVVFAGCFTGVAAHTVAAQAPTRIVQRDPRPASPIRLATRDGFLPVDDSVRLFYRVVGDGPDTVVVLHGGPGLHFNTIAPDLTPLATRATLIFFDQRGAGRSSAVPDTSWLNARFLVSDLEAVRRHFRLDRMTLIGHSWGSLLAGLYAVQHPERVRRMVLIASSPPARAIRKFDPAERIDSALNVVRLANNAAWRTRSDSTKACWDYWLIFLRGYFETPADVRRTWGDMCNVPPAAMLNPSRAYAMTSLGDWDLRPMLARVSAPVLVVHGTLDPMDTSSARAWTASFPNARLLLIQSAGHFPQVDHPAEFFPAVAEFVHGVWPRHATSQRDETGRATESSDAAKRPAVEPRMSAQQQGSTVYGRVYAAIQSTSDSLADAIGRQDWTGASRLYTDDGLLLAPGMLPMSGRQAIAAYWRAAHDKGLHSLELQTMQVDGDAGAITEIGKYVLRGEGAVLLDVGKYLVEWRRVSGGWRIQRDVYNSSLETRSPLEAPDYLALPRSH